MARARTLKPGFFANERLAECEPLARLLFEGLWCYADREGRLEDRPRRLKAEILPYDECNVENLLGQLEARAFIERYSVGDDRYIRIPKFLQHQNPHSKEVPSKIPAPPKQAPRKAQVIALHNPGGDEHQPRSVPASPKPEPAGPSPLTPLPSPEEPPHPSGASPQAAEVFDEPRPRKQRIAADWCLTPADIAYAFEEHGWPLERIQREAAEFKHWHEESGKKRLDFGRAWQSWVRKSVGFEQQRGQSRGNGSGTPSVVQAIVEGVARAAAPAAHR